MKFMARRAFMFSFVIAAPFVGILGASKAERFISSSESDTVSVKVISKDNGTDSLLNAIFQATKQTNNKLDTGLKRQTLYMQLQAFQATKFDQLRDTINNLNHQLKIKTALPTQIIKDAEKGNAQKTALKLIWIIAFALLIIVGVLVGILVLIYNFNRNKQLTSSV